MRQAAYYGGTTAPDAGAAVSSRWGIDSHFIDSHFFDRWDGLHDRDSLGIIRRSPDEGRGWGGSRVRDMDITRRYPDEGQHIVPGIIRRYPDDGQDMGLHFDERWGNWRDRDMGLHFDDRWWGDKRKVLSNG